MNLKRLMDNKSRYDFDRERIPEQEVDEYKSRRLELAEDVITAHRNRARGLLLRDFPELKEATRQDKRNRAAVRRGRSTPALDALIGQ